MFAAQRFHFENLQLRGSPAMQGHTLPVLEKPHAAEEQTQDQGERAKDDDVTGTEHNGCIVPRTPNSACRG